ncbi:MAG: Sporulation kinase [Candidatus Carbobacillus altaicus]|uniref:histidine kinase n=1 Tax=Candidatus Carbonibacillus altaicus TaxID=2163959 RepID=A0A2R6Y1Z7_9BACL|nr:MAG: Sporulation kinase [Candidatus Carbobacillus altaicus]
MKHAENRWQSLLKGWSTSALLLDQYGNVLAQTDDQLRAVFFQAFNQLKTSHIIRDQDDQVYAEEQKNNLMHQDALIMIEQFLSADDVMNHKHMRLFGLLSREAFLRFGDGLLIVDETGKVLAANHMFIEYFELSARMEAGVWLDSELEPPYIKDLFMALPVDDWPLPPRLLEGVETRDEPYAYPSSSRTRTLSRSVYHLRHNKQQTFILAQFKELSHFMNIDEKILRTDRLATIGQMAAGTAHEIRNPLTSIRGFLQILQDSLKEKQMETEYGYVQLMLKEIARINSLVEQFLLLGKPRDVHFRKINLEKVLDDIIPVLQSEAILHNIHISAEYRDPLPEIIADPDLIKQVVINIVKNAIEAIWQNGKITISVSVQKEEKIVIIKIHDTGPGIPPYIIDRIFDPFFTTKEKGSGLGLSVCQRIVQDMGGNIRVLSKGFGTTFQVILPFASGETCAD